MREIHITEVRLATAPRGASRRGLVGWISLVLNGHLEIDGIALRRTVHDRLVLSFPSRKDGEGRLHPIVRPVDDATRREIEFQVFAALGFGESVHE